MGFLMGRNRMNVADFRLNVKIKLKSDNIMQVIHSITKYRKQSLNINVVLAKSSSTATEGKKINIGPEHIFYLANMYIGRKHEKILEL